MTDNAMSDPLDAWMDGYLRAWNSNDPADIADLFTDDARYYTAPFRPPWTGRDEIVKKWLERKDEPGDTTFSWRPLVVAPDIAVIQGETAYLSDRETFSNLWVLRLDDTGRCREFTEWWMEQQPGS